MSESKNGNLDGSMLKPGDYKIEPEEDEKRVKDLSQEHIHHSLERNRVRSVPVWTPGTTRAMTYLYSDHLADAQNK